MITRLSSSAARALGFVNAQCKCRARNSSSERVLSAKLEMQYSKSEGRSLTPRSAVFVSKCLPLQSSSLSPLWNARAPNLECQSVMIFLFELLPHLIATKVAPCHIAKCDLCWVPETL